MRAMENAAVSNGSIFLPGNLPYNVQGDGIDFYGYGVSYDTLI